MGEIAHLDNFRSKPEPGELSYSGQAKCIACKHEWVAVITVESEDGTDIGLSQPFSCPACGCHRGQMKWPFDGPPAEEVWTCMPCGGTLFMITRQGTRCIGCGRHQVFPASGV